MGPADDSTLDRLEAAARRAGLVAALATLAAILSGLMRSAGRRPGREAGRPPGFLRRPAFYLGGGAAFLAACYATWRPLALPLGRPGRLLALLGGGPAFFAGLGLVLAGRLALGEMYGASSALGARLYAGHRLVTGGPFGRVRHPMYLGLMLVAAGGLLLYQTWTFVLLLAQAPVLVARAGREEAALAAEFGEEWRAYCRRAPAWLPAMGFGRR
jgi:protein-S-isoprenylcysteine O-methyltransferase Ste14